MPTGYTLDSVWFSILAGSQTDAFYGATCYTSKDCIMVGRSFLDGVIVVTHSRGTTWTRTSFSSNPFTDVASRTLSGSTIMLAVTSTGRIYYSYDSSTWSWVAVSGALYSIAIGSNGKFFFLNRNSK